VSSSAVKALNNQSSHESWTLRQPLPGDSTIARYNRVAAVETVLNIRNQQQQTVRYFIVGVLVLTGLTVMVAGVMGWL